VANADVKSIAEHFAPTGFGCSQGQSDGLLGCRCNTQQTAFRV